MYRKGRLMRIGASPRATGPCTIIGCLEKIVLFGCCAGRGDGIRALDISGGLA